MSRYLKTATATVYRNKKTYLVPGNYTFNVPFTSNEVKVMVFGGGGNSCYSPITGAGTNGNSGLTYAAASGPGGGFAEKLFTGAAGSSACIVLGSCTANSSFCISGQGTVLATGGRLCGGSGTPWCHCFGIGSGGDTNRCGAPGQTQCMCKFCDVNSTCSCVCFCGGAYLSGGSPGNSVNNGVYDVLVPCNTGNFSCFAITCGQFYGYGCTICRCYTSYRQNGSFTRAYGCCPVSSATYYGFDWDVVGGDSCSTANFTCASGYGYLTLASNQASGYCGCSCCCSTVFGQGCFGTACSGGPGMSTIGTCCFSFVRYECLQPCIRCAAGSTAGVTGSSGPGGNGGVGGGGGGIFINGEVNVSCDWRCAGLYMTGTSWTEGCCMGTGGAGLVIVYY